jgi:molybdenum cofactor biosynthesis enzyme MoaA
VFSTANGSSTVGRARLRTGPALPAAGRDDVRHHCVTTEPFCTACDCSRQTADGLWLLCLYARGGLDLRHPLREGPTGSSLSRRSSATRTWRCIPEAGNRRAVRAANA